MVWDGRALNPIPFPFHGQGQFPLNHGAPMGPGRIPGIQGIWEFLPKIPPEFPLFHLEHIPCVLSSQSLVKIFGISSQRMGNVPAWCQSSGKARKFHFPSPMIDFLLLENWDNTGIKMGMKMAGIFPSYSSNWDGNDPRSTRSNSFPWEKGAWIFLAPPTGFLWRDP